MRSLSYKYVTAYEGTKYWGAGGGEQNGFKALKLKSFLKPPAPPAPLIIIQNQQQQEVYFLFSSLPLLLIRNEFKHFISHWKRKKMQNC